MAKSLKKGVEVEVITGDHKGKKRKNTSSITLQKPYYRRRSEPDQETREEIPRQSSRFHR